MKVSGNKERKRQGIVLARSKENMREKRDAWENGNYENEMGGRGEQENVCTLKGIQEYRDSSPTDYLVIRLSPFYNLYKPPPPPSLMDLWLVISVISDLWSDHVIHPRDSFFSLPLYHFPNHNILKYHGTCSRFSTGR